MNNDDPLEGLWFSFEMDEEEYVAFITMEALRIHFHATGKGKRQLLRAYLENEAQIKAVARHRFRNNAPRPLRLDLNSFGRVYVLPQAAKALA